MADAGLRKIFSDHLTEAHWQPVETWSTGQGVPDVEYCFPGGFSGWIENKWTQAFALAIDGKQVAWIERRVRVGGRVFVAIRQKRDASARIEARDALFLFAGSAVRKLYREGLKTDVSPLLISYGKPEKWDWVAVKKILTT